MNTIAPALNNISKVESSTTLLVVDVGATKTDMAIYNILDGEFICGKQERFVSRRFRDFTELLDQFNFTSSKVDAISIAFAGPVIDGVGRATNLDWVIDERELSRELKGVPVFLLNDLKAHAYGLGRIPENELVQIHKGNSFRAGNAAIIAPGTGLGEAGLFWDGEKHHPFATEGGHADFGPRTDKEDSLLKWLRSKFGHVSWERVLSGPGIWNIYEFLRETYQAPYPNYFNDIQQTRDKAIMVSSGALKHDPICLEALKMFYKFLAVESANLAVKLNARGGIFVGGGIVPNTLELLNKRIFVQHFYDLGRLRPLLENIPIHVICNKQTALIGAALFGVEALQKMSLSV